MLTMHAAYHTCTLAKNHIFLFKIASVSQVHCFTYHNALESQPLEAAWTKVFLLNLSGHTLCCRRRCAEHARVAKDLLKLEALEQMHATSVHKRAPESQVAQSRRLTSTCLTLNRNASEPS